MAGLPTPRYGLPMLPLPLLVLPLLTLLGCQDPAPTGTPRLALDTPRAVQPAALAQAVWGPAGPTLSFGRDPDALVGPKAIFADGDGFAVLDQENLRILRFDADGALLGALPVPARSVLDADSTGSGFGLLIYHRTPKPGHTVARISPAGEITSELEVAPTIDAPSAIFHADGRLWVEQAHDAVCEPDVDPCFLGRPDGSGWFVAAEKLDEHLLRLNWSNQPRKAAPTKEDEALQQEPRRVVLHTDRRLSNVVALDPFFEEGEHRVMVAMLLYDEGPAPRFEMTDPEIRVVVTDWSGHPLDELRLEVGLETSMTRHIALGVGGRLYRLRTDEAGAHVDRVDLSRTLPRAP